MDRHLRLYRGRFPQRRRRRWRRYQLPETVHIWPQNSSVFVAAAESAAGSEGDASSRGRHRSAPSDCCGGRDGGGVSWPSSNAVEASGSNDVECHVVHIHDHPVRRRITPHAQELLSSPSLPPSSIPGYICAYSVGQSRSAESVSHDVCLHVNNNGLKTAEKRRHHTNRTL